MLKKLSSVLAITISFLLVISATAASAQQDETTETTEEAAVEATEAPEPIAEPTSVPEPVDPVESTTAPEAAATTTTAAPASSTTVTVVPTEADPFLHQAGRLYRATLGREADEAGRAFWADRLREGYPLEEVARFMLDSEEARMTSGDVILDAYRWALSREPEEGGYAYWSQFDDPALAVAAVSDSLEHQMITATLPPPARVEPPLASGATAGAGGDHPAGWVDAGHGVWVPKILIDIRFCESRHSYTAKNSRSTASGGYQFLNSSWAAYGHAARYGVRRAMDATPAQQDEAALMTWERDGTRPWYASRHCWG